ncbi:lysozyme C-like [Clarias gariepinus]|uniref:lysozyme C-like n=1 Tax=Clarias gariepinus TaxID=13013 RepID=UPI00234D8BBB|nr:lysozyme C-like [Clarias gariepinus]
MKVLVFFLLLAGVSAKKYDQCKLAKDLKAAGMDGFNGVTLAQWVCLAKYVSDFNTNKVVVDIDGSTDFGIFQISNRWWCTDGKFKSANGCKLSCSELIKDDITKSIACAKTILKEQGPKAWVAWSNKCKACEAASYIGGCGV